MTAAERKRIYNETVRALENGALPKEELFESVASRLGISVPELQHSSAGSRGAYIRASFGEVLEGMLGRGLIADESGIISLSVTRPVTIHAAECERQILALLSERPMTKKQIRTALEAYFGTRRTASLKDDNVLFSHLGQILKRLVNERTLVLRDEFYSVCLQCSAKIGDMSAMLELKAEFLGRIHSKGGEFFEHYFVELLSLYLKKHGKTVLDAYVTGGSADGGIDGVIKTVDCLGFRETVMIQTKNRNVYTAETEVRGFYGAVCARMGSRGVYATSSDFHKTAAAFLASIDNCVGVNGDKLFEMAVECGFGIRKRGGKYTLDKKVM